MKKLGLEDVKKIQLDILQMVADFCDKNGLRYWLDSGTLLGAVRHKGYIPWDDDIDIAMLRDDYDRFSESFNRENERYRFVSLKTDRNFYCSFAKVFDTATLLYEPDENGERSAVNIDVFVHDNAPDDDRLLEKQYRKRDIFKVLNGLQKKCYNHHGNPVKKVALNTAYAITNLLPRSYFLRRIEKNSQKYRNAETKRVGNFVDIAEHMVCSKQALSAFVRLEFEDREFWAPADYDAWLTSIYGDYMQLPPEEERVSHHLFQAYLLDEKV